MNISCIKFVVIKDIILKELVEEGQHGKEILGMCAVNSSMLKLYCHELNNTRCLLLSFYILRYAQRELSFLEFTGYMWVSQRAIWLKAVISQFCIILNLSVTYTDKEFNCWKKIELCIKLHKI